MSRLADLESDELEVVNAAIDEFSGELSLSDFENWSLGGWRMDIINSCFKYNTIEEIFAALELAGKNSDNERASWATKQLNTMRSMSPTSLKVPVTDTGHARAAASWIQDEH
jgi:3-hydroxyisobutyryl-CoA hydrolase